MMPAVLDDLRRLSSAEDFFAYLDVPCDRALVQVSRLHILRRMGQILAGSGLEALSDDEARFTARAALAQAHGDLAAEGPLQRRLFKVHQDAAAPKAAPPRAFVPLGDLTGAGPATQGA